MSDFYGTVIINNKEFPLIDGTISYKNAYQYSINVKLPKYAIDYEQHNTITVKLTDGITTLYYDGVIERVTLDDMTTIVAKDPTSKLDYAYYEWIELAQNIKSHTLPYENGMLNITQYVKEAIIDNYIAPFLTRPVTYQEEWILIEEDTFKGFVLGIAEEILKNPSLSNILNLLQKFGVTMIYDGTQYTIIGAKTLWNKYTTFPSFAENDDDVIAIGDAEVDMTKKFDQIIVKNTTVADDQFIAKYPNTLNIDNPRVKVEFISTPLFDKALLQRIANLVYLDYHMQFAKTKVILSRPDRLNIYNNVTIKIIQGLAIWETNIPIVPDWVDENGTIWHGQGYDFIVYVGSGISAKEVGNLINVSNPFKLEVGATIGAKEKATDNVNVTHPFFMYVGATIGAKVFF